MVASFATTIASQPLGRTVIENPSTLLSLQKPCETRALSVVGISKLLGVTVCFGKKEDQLMRKT